MASLALHLKSHHQKPSQFLLKSTSSNLTFSLLHSSSSSSDNNNNDGGNPPDKPHPISSNFDGIKYKLKHLEQQLEQEQQTSGFKYSNIGVNPQGSLNPNNAASFDEIKKDLSEFRRQSLGLEQQQKQTKFQTGNAGNPNDNAGKNTGSISFDSLRENLRKMKGTGVDGSNTSAEMSLNNYKQSLKMDTHDPYFRESRESILSLDKSSKDNRLKNDPTLEDEEKQSHNYFSELKKSLPSLDNSSKDNGLKNAPRSSGAAADPGVQTKGSTGSKKIKIEQSINRSRSSNQG